MGRGSGAGYKQAVVTGAAGMLGSALLDLAPASLEVTGIDLPDGDLSEPEATRAALESRQPEIVIHCAAWTEVDGCTRDPERAFRYNALATENVARACRELNARLLVMSTDYVFDGTKGAPYTEQDPTNPLNPYGESKLAAERLAAEQATDLVIVRTAWLFGPGPSASLRPGGRDFVATVVAHARETGEVRAVADQWGSPTYTRDLAGGLWQAALAPVRGVVHLTGGGQCTWADLAEHALRAAGLEDIKVERISYQEWPSPTHRPRFSVLDNQRWARLGFEPLRSWTEAVEEYVEECLR